MIPLSLTKGGEALFPTGSLSLSPKGGGSLPNRIPLSHLRKGGSLPNMIPSPLRRLEGSMRLIPSSLKEAGGLYAPPFLR